MQCLETLCALAWITCWREARVGDWSRWGGKLGAEKAPTGSGRVSRCKPLWIRPSILRCPWSFTCRDDTLLLQWSRQLVGPHAALKHLGVGSGLESRHLCSHWGPQGSLITAVGFAWRRAVIQRQCSPGSGLWTENGKLLVTSQCGVAQHSSLSGCPQRAHGVPRPLHTHSLQSAGEEGALPFLPSISVLPSELQVIDSGWFSPQDHLLSDKHAHTTAFFTSSHLSSR